MHLSFFTGFLLEDFEASTLLDYKPLRLQSPYQLQYFFQFLNSSIQVSSLISLIEVTIWRAADRGDRMERHLELFDNFFRKQEVFFFIFKYSISWYSLHRDKSISVNILKPADYTLMNMTMLSSGLLMLLLLC